MRGSPTAEIFFDNVEIPEGELDLILGVDSKLTDRECSRRSRQRRQGPHVGLGPRTACAEWRTTRVSPARACPSSSLCTVNPRDRQGRRPRALSCWLLKKTGRTKADLSIMQAGLDITLDYTHDRKQFGQKIATFQLMQGKLAGELPVDIIVLVHASHHRSISYSSYLILSLPCLLPRDFASSRALVRRNVAFENWQD